MFEFAKLCHRFESMNAVERGACLADSSVRVLAKLALLDGAEEVRPLEALAGFIIGSAVGDGKLDEREYLLMYPTLVRALGEDFDFATVKASIESDREGAKTLRKDTEEMVRIYSLLDDSLREDLLMLCLCVTSVDGKVTLKERNYIRRLLRA